MMLDSGNLIPTGVAISDRFLKECGASLVRKMRKKCNTAKQGDENAMWQIGERTKVLECIILKISEVSQRLRYFIIEYSLMIRIQTNLRKKLLGVL